MDLLSLLYFAITPLLIGSLTVFILLSLFGIGFLIIYAKEWMIQEKDRPVLVGTVFNQLIYLNTLHDYYLHFARKHRCFRYFLSPSHSEIYTVDPVHVEHILKTNFSNYTKVSSKQVYLDDNRGLEFNQTVFQGVYHYDIMHDLLGDGIFAVDGEKWRHQRKLASYEFSTKNLKDFSSTVFRTNAVKLVVQISKFANAGESMDMQGLLMKSTLDSIFKVGFGIEINSLYGSDEFSNKFTHAFDDSNAITYRRYVDPFWKIERFLNIGLEASLKRNVKVIDDFVFEAIRCRREQMKSENGLKVKEDILSRFIVESEKDPDNMTDRYLRDIILNFMIAGKDTSANTLTWFFYMLCKHPLIKEKIFQEIREATKVDHAILPDAFAEKLSQEALDRMQYLHASLTETLRLYPAVPVDGKSSEDDDVLPDGLRIRKGDGINYVPYAMGRMTYIWGDDAEEFRPERWIENGIFRPESYFKFTAFQAGPRICLGKEFAYRQMKIVASVLLNFFKFQLEDPKKEATYRTMFTLHMDQGLNLIAVPRM